MVRWACSPGRCGVGLVVLALTTGVGCDQRFGCAGGATRVSGPGPAARGRAPVRLERSPPDAHDQVALGALVRRIEPLHERLGRPSPGDWLWEHDEPGQTFEQYRRASPPPVAGVLYLQPLGALDEAERRMVLLAADYLERFFGLQVEVEDALPLSVVPTEARRTHPSEGGRQLLTSQLMTDILRPRLPEGGAAMLGFTTEDLWPGDGYNFVFGQASLHDRVGIWSIHRAGDPHLGGEAFRTTLRRMLKTAVHEATHMFAAEHCTAYACVMNGSNSLEESDARPLWLCPECLAKVLWVTGQEPAQRYFRLADFARRHQLEREEAFFSRSMEATEPR
ncbi:MAG: hypothetical protein KC731_15210 [Myxococcales bacterium]|nr:hypothetical protein [Myxococcales bacterium]